MLTNLLKQLKNEPENTLFSEVISVINENYLYTPTSFINGDIENVAGTNEGSCKIFAFAQLNNLNEQQTLACFGDYYRIDVLLHPEGNVLGLTFHLSEHWLPQRLTSPEFNSSPNAILETQGARASATCPSDLYDQPRPLQ